MNQDQQIVPGILLSSSGQATVDPALTNELIEIAIKIDDNSKHPVDVEHVLAAIVLAAQSGAIDPTTVLSTDDDPLISVLADHVETVFEKFGGRVGADDSILVSKMKMIDIHGEWRFKFDHQPRWEFRAWLSVSISIPN